LEGNPREIGRKVLEVLEVFHRSVVLLEPGVYLSDPMGVFNIVVSLVVYVV